MLSVNPHRAAPVRVFDSMMMSALSVSFIYCSPQAVFEPVRKQYMMHGVSTSDTYKKNYDDFLNRCADCQINFLRSLSMKAYRFYCYCHRSARLKYSSLRHLCCYQT